MRQMQSFPAQLYRLVVIAVVILGLVQLQSRGYGQHDNMGAAMHLWHGRSIQNISKAAHNETLGFGNVYYISLPE
jgi:hypothetical protein